MRSITRVSLTATAVAALVLIGAVPAMAAEDDTTATVEVQGGALSITAPESIVLTAVAPDAVASGVLTGVAVDDARAGVTNWSINMSITAFASAAAPALIIPANTVTYTPGTAEVTGIATVTPATANAGSGVVQTATAVTGNNTATWDATISVAVPSDALAAADYTATLTHSVL